MKLVKTVVLSAVVESSLVADTGIDMGIFPYIGALF
jgi:hypothetical protein